MNEIRKKKLEAAILRELSELIQRRRVKDDRIGFVSISRINLTPDLSELSVFVSLFGEEKENEDTWRALSRHAGFFQSRLSRDLRLRLTPHLVFRIDESVKEGDRLLETIEEGRTDADRASEKSDQNQA